MKLYNKLSVNIEDDMDIIKIIKSLRELKILASNSMMNVLTRFQIDHASKNIINLESADGGETSESTCD